MEQQMTIKQVLEITVSSLGNIAVPRALNQQIGLPIDQAIANLQLCIDALEKNETEAKNKKEQELEVRELPEEAITDGNIDAE